MADAGLGIGQLSAAERAQAHQHRGGRSPLREPADQGCGPVHSAPASAFALLRPGNSNAIRYLGPSFFTKFLYFAGGGAPDHPCLILDRVVATRLRDRCGWTSLHREGPWPAETYERYCGLLARWGQETGRAPDEIELKLFNSFSVDRN